MKVARLATILLALASFPLHAQQAQAHDAASMEAMGAMMNGDEGTMARPHLHLSPTRAPTRDDSVRARQVVLELRTAIAKYADTSAAIADGYEFHPRFPRAPKVYHYTNRRNALKSAIMFDPKRPTSLLYERQSDGRLRLIGAMYTAPRRVSLDELDERIPLSIATWHQHVNVCMPKKGEEGRLTEREGRRRVFGAGSPITTREACDAVGGRFSGDKVPWMVHVNVFAGDDLGTIFRHEH